MFNSATGATSCPTQPVGQGQVCCCVERQSDRELQWFRLCARSSVSQHVAISNAGGNYLPVRCAGETARLHGCLTSASARAGMDNAWTTVGETPHPKVHVCICICMCVHTCVCIHVYACVCVYICLQVCVLCTIVYMYPCECLCPCVHMHLCMWIPVYMYVCVYYATYVYMHECMYACMHACMYVFMHERMYTWVSVCVHVVCTCLCMRMF